MWLYHSATEAAQYIGWEHIHTLIYINRPCNITILCIYKPDKLANSNSVCTYTNLYLGSHGYPVQRVYIGLAASATEEELGEGRLLVLWEVGEEELEELVGKVQDLDGGCGHN